MALAGIGSHVKDKENFTLLLQAVREGWTLSAEDIC